MRVSLNSWIRSYNDSNEQFSRLNFGPECDHVGEMSEGMGFTEFFGDELVEAAQVEALLGYVFDQENLLFLQVFTFDV